MMGAFISPTYLGGKNMRAVIYDDKYAKPYESAILAIDNRDVCRYFYVVNKDNEVERIKDIEEISFFPYEQIILVRNGDVNFPDWVVSEKIIGYKWFIDNINDLESIKSRCLMQNQDELTWYRTHRKWLYIRSQQDINDLLTFTQHFNFGHIAYALYRYADDVLVLHIVTEYFDQIILRFRGNIDTNIGWNNIKYDSNNQIESCKLYFSNSNSICFEFDDIYIYANKLSFNFKVTTRRNDVIYVNPKNEENGGVKIIWKKR